MSVGPKSHGGKGGNQTKQESGLIRLILLIMPTLEYYKVSIGSYVSVGADKVSVVAVWGN